MDNSTEAERQRERKKPRLALVQRYAQRSGLTIRESSLIVRDVLASVRDTLQDGNSVRIPGLGTLMPGKGKVIFRNSRDPGE
jgi:nucleoid DNA-binding protein